MLGKGMRRGSCSVGSSAAPNRDIDEILASPVFIVGAPRSGTTWLQRLLLSHDSICGGQETHFFSIFAEVMKRFRSGACNERRVGLACYWSETALRREILSLWFRTMTPVVQDNPGTEYLLDKSPGHALFLRDILEFLPAARFVHIIRDSRSVVASLLAASKQPWGKGWSPGKAKDAAVVWWQHVKTAREVGRTLSGQTYMEIFYEDLRADPVAGIMKVFDFVGVGISDRRADEVVRTQELARQKAIGGTRFRGVKGASVSTDAVREPEGFFREGLVDGWKRDLKLWEALVVWRYTRRLMWECGYSWKGR